MNTTFHQLTVRTLTAAVAVAFCSCASVERQTSPAQSDRPAPGKGLVTFYRERKLVGMAVGFNVRDGGQKIGGLPNGSYFAYQAAPGPHRFTAATESTTEANLQVQQGRSYYIRGTLQMGAFVGRPRLVIVAPEEGAPASRSLRRVALRPE